MNITITNYIVTALVLVVSISAFIHWKEKGDDKKWHHIFWLFLIFIAFFIVHFILVFIYSLIWK